MSINPNLSFEHFMRAAVEEANKRMTLSGDKKRTHIRVKCGICGERYELCEMIRDNGSDTGGFATTATTSSTRNTKIFGNTNCKFTY